MPSATKFGINSFRIYAADLCKMFANSSIECSTIQASVIQSINCCAVIFDLTFWATMQSIFLLLSSRGLVARFDGTVARFDGSVARFKYLKG